MTDFNPDNFDVTFNATVSVPRHSTLELIEPLCALWLLKAHNEKPVLLVIVNISNGIIGKLLFPIKRLPCLD